MKKLKPFNDNAEVIGSMFKSFFVSVNLDNFKHILQAYGLKGAEDIDPNKWYRHTLCMDIFREIGQQPDLFDEVSLGMASVRVGHIEQYFTDIIEALKALPARTESTHRNSTDYIKVELLDSNHATIEDHTVWPHNAMYGVFYEMVRTFCKDFVVRRSGVGIDPITGDEFGIYEVRWS